MTNKTQERAGDILQMIRFKNRILAEEKSKRQIWLKENTANLTLEQLLSLLQYEASNMSTQKYNECLGMLLFKISKIDKKSFYDTPAGTNERGEPDYTPEQINDASDAVHIQDHLLNAFKTAERQMSVEYNRALLED
jgi:hypothetical protein